MVNDGELSEVLSEFARTVITDFPIQGILDHLVTRIVDVLPIDSAGVTLIADGRAPHYSHRGGRLRIRRFPQQHRDVRGHPQRLERA